MAPKGPIYAEMPLVCISEYVSASVARVWRYKNLIITITITITIKKLLTHSLT